MALFGPPWVSSQGRSKFWNPLMKAISIAQGLTQYARKKGIEVTRMLNGVQTKMEVDLKAIEEHKVEDIRLMADDQILVPRKRF